MKKRALLITNAVVNVICNLLFCYYCFTFFIMNPVGIFMGLIGSAAHIVSLYFLEQYFVERQWSTPEKFFKASTLPSIATGGVVFVLVLVLNELDVLDGYGGLGGIIVCFAYMHHCLDIFIGMCIAQRSIKKRLK